MSKPSRLSRPLSANAASKLPTGRKEDFSSRSRKISLGEKILRAGSEGNLAKQQQVQTTPKSTKQSGSNAIKDQKKSNMHGASLEDAECQQSKENLSNGNSHIQPKAGRNILRRHTVGGPRSSKEILGMQTSEMDRKREAFLEHLKYKYPHHATAIMGHQERLRDQAVHCMLASLHSELDIQRYLMKIESSQRTKSPNLSSSPQPSLGEQAEHLSEVFADPGDTMFEGESLMPFVRGSRTRASLPVVRSTNQTKERSLGVLFLQYGEDTKKLQMPNEITSVDTIRALFVSAFPQQLTMKVLESRSTAIYIKDDGRNIYYELSDVRNIQDRAFLKVYNKDPAQAFNHTPRTVNGDVRMQREISYSVREGPAVHRPGSATYSSHGGPISPPPTPVPHSMPPSPSRIPYGGARPAVVQSNSTMPRERLSSLPVSRSISPSPSAILERRDVKPDEDMGNKNIQLLRNEGMYGDPYLYHEGRMSVASSHGGHPLDVPDHLIAYHRGAMRSASTYSNSSMQVEMEQSMYRQKTRKHSESHLPSLGSKTPPASPHRVTDMRMMDIHTHNPHVPPHAIQTDRSSPIRHSFKKEQGVGMFVEAKLRNPIGIPGMTEVISSPSDKQGFGGYGVAAPPKDTYTRERMHAMEKQIASLTGLVQSALLKGPSPNNSKDAPSEKVFKTSNSKTPNADSAGAHILYSGKNSLAIESTTLISRPSAAASSTTRVSLHDMRRNVTDLRIQLHKMRQLQLQNQEMLRVMMKKAEMEISSKVTEMIKSLEDPVQRQRVLVEQERQKYLHEEEQIVMKLGDLEGFVEELKKDSTTSNRVITLKDVEDRAFFLRQIGEAVSNLKGEFPHLQNKMRAVLRVEVEAVRFLKEEPHKLDSLLKRIRNMTDALSALRRYVTDEPSKVMDLNQNTQYIITEKCTETDVIQSQDEKTHVYLQPTQTEVGVTAESKTTSVKSEVVPLSAGVKVHQVQSLPVVIQQSQHSSALVHHLPNSNNLTSTSADVLVTHQLAGKPVAVTQEPSGGFQQALAPQSPQNNGSSMQTLFIEEIQHASYRNRAVSIEEAERKFEEKRQNLDHYNSKEFEKMLEEAQANIMKSIPSLEIPSQSLKVDLVDKVEVIEGGPDNEHDNDKVMKSPPPPPPRRIYPPGFGLSSVWTGEASYTVRKENSKDSNEEVLPAPQSKTPKLETEDQSLNPMSASVIKDEEEEEGERIMAELQVSCTISKEFLNPESPKHVESPEDKWKKQNLENIAPDAIKDREGNAHLVNEKSTYSLLIGREQHKESGPKTRENPHGEIAFDKKSEKENVAIITYPSEQEKTNILSGMLTDKGIIINKTEASNSPSFHFANSEKKSEVLETQDLLLASKALQEREMPYLDVGQTVVLRPKTSRKNVSQQIEDIDSPTRSPSEPKSPVDNIAFMITKTEVQLLSSGEVKDLVSRKGGEVHTVNIDGGKAEKSLSGNTENVGPEDPSIFTDKKPVIIIFDEPMDIRSAYKRLSTIFEECDDELENMLSQERIVEEEEDEEESDMPPSQLDINKKGNNVTYSENLVSDKPYKFNYPSLAQIKKKCLENENLSRTHLTDEEKSDASDDQFGQRQDAKKKFKFKFPKKQLAALSQAIRTGTKTGKKTLQVVVYEEEEEPDGTVKQHKEAKRFEIARSKTESTKFGYEKHTPQETLSLEPTDQVSRTDEIRKNTYRTLNSLEQTIKQLESTMSEMTPKAVPETVDVREENRTSPDVQAIAKETILMDETKAVLESPTSIPTTARKGSNGASQTSRMPIPMSSKSRQGNMEKTSKQPKLQEPQHQYRQANGGTKKAGGDFKAASPTLSASKIPGLSSNTGKSSSVSAQCNDTSNSPIQPAKSHVSVTNSVNTQTGRAINSSSLIRPVHNGSSKLQSPSYVGKGHHLSFSLQNSNGRPSPPTAAAAASSSSSASSPPTSVSPTSLTQGMKSIRTIHTPSFTSYKSQNGNASKNPTAKETS
ncbi:sickle tail protein homolog isoform X4 [Ascaphus truei]|uniref:sickle tail protein homolog isoform X4 n=1 Tax=Ascaphus truei TaxID=8439 RepID=UPI003F599A61